VATDDVYEVAIVGAQTGSLIVSTLHYRTFAGGVGTKQQEMLALAEAVLNEIIPSMAALCVDTLIWDTIRVRDVHDDTLGVDRSISGAGALSSEGMPKQIAALILWRTGFIGRSNQGRLYLPAISEAWWDGEAWVSGFLTAVTAFAGEVTAVAIADFPDPGNDFAFDQVVYSKLNDVARNVISFGLSPQPATQRRRKSGVGS
jgi:hypothetical protein